MKKLTALLLFSAATILLSSCSQAQSAPHVITGSYISERAVETIIGTEFYPSLVVSNDGEMAHFNFGFMPKGPLTGCGTVEGDIYTVISNDGIEGTHYFRIIDEYTLEYLGSKAEGMMAYTGMAEAGDIFVWKYEEFPQ